MANPNRAQFTKCASYAIPSTTQWKVDFFRFFGARIIILGQQKPEMTFQLRESFSPHRQSVNSAAGHREKKSTKSTITPEIFRVRKIGFLWVSFGARIIILTTTTTTVSRDTNF